MNKLLYVLIVLASIGIASAALTDNLQVASDWLSSTTIVDFATSNATNWTQVGTITTCTNGVLPGVCKSTANARLQNSLNLIPSSATQAFTVQFFVNTTTTGDNQLLDTRGSASPGIRLGKIGANNTVFFGYGNATAGNTLYTSAQLAQNKQTMITAIFNSTAGGRTVLIYANNTLVLNASINGGSMQSAQSTTLFSEADGNIQELNGSISYFRVWHRALTFAEVNSTYNNGTGCSYSSLLNNCGGSTSVFQITLMDLYNNASITNFNATLQLNGTTASFSTTNGTIVTNYTTNSGLLANVTLQSTGYFNYTSTNYNISTNLNAATYAGVQTFNISEIISNSTIYNFSVRNDLGTLFTGEYNITVYLPKLSNGVAVPYTFNYTFNRSGYYNSGFTQQLILSASSFPFNGSIRTANIATKYYLNITSVNAQTGSSVSSFVVNITSGLYNYSVIRNTTNGSVVEPWTNDSNLNITVYNATISITSLLWNTTNYTAPSVVNINLSGSTTNSYLFNIFNEVNGSLITDSNISIYMTSSTASYNFTTGNGTYFATLLSPVLYQLTASSNSYSTRTYFVVVTNQTTNTKNIYLLPNGYNTVKVSVYDPSYTALPNYFVSITKKNLSGTNYYETERCITDSNGQCIVSMVLCSDTNSSCPYYRAITYDPTQTTILQDTGDIRIKSDQPALTITVNNNDVVSNIINYYGTTQYVSTIDPSTGVSTYYFDNTLGLASSISFVIQRRVGNSWTTLQSLSTSGSGELLITSSSTNTSIGDEFQAIGYWTDVSGVTHIGGKKNLIPTTSGVGASRNSAVSFVGLGIALGPLVFMGAVGPILAPVISVALLYMMNLMGVASFTTNAIGAVIIIVAVTLWVMFS